MVPSSLESGEKSQLYQVVSIYCMINCVFVWVPNLCLEDSCSGHGVMEYIGYKIFPSTKLYNYYIFN